MLLNRLIAATTTNTSGVQWGDSYTYDGFGNLTSKVSTLGRAPSVTPQVNSANNQARVLGDYGFDANGNWLGVPESAPLNNIVNTYNVENQLISTGTGDGFGDPLTYTYDPWGKRVLQASASSTYGPTGTLYFYSITGQRLVTYQLDYMSGTQISVNIYFGKRLLAPMDRLGSVRGNPNGAIAYYPWGEERTSTPNATDKYATYFRDAVINGTGQDYAGARYYNNNFGRFWSPDPAGILAAHPGNPTSWNRYAYAMDDPVNGNDPTGLVPQISISCCGTPSGCDWNTEGVAGCTGIINDPNQPPTSASCPNPTGCTNNEISTGTGSGKGAGAAAVENEIRAAGFMASVLLAIPTCSKVVGTGTAANGLTVTAQTVLTGLIFHCCPKQDRPVAGPSENAGLTAP